MSSQLDRASTFHRLHVKGHPLVLYNIWDAGSAQVVARAGAPAIATGSWAVAAAHGYADGELLPFEIVLANLREIVAAVDLPVTIDLESGYGRTPDAVAASTVAVLKNGAIGFNLEDRIIGAHTLYSAADQSARLRAARSAADQLAVPAFINARTDLFFQTDRAQHDAALLASALDRAHAYAAAGASGLFTPGLVDESLIGMLCQRSPLPVNLLLVPNAPTPKRLAELGVSRVSHGPGPYRRAMQLVEDGARQIYAQ